MSSGSFVIAFKLKFYIFLGRHIRLQTVLHKNPITPCLNAYRQFFLLLMFFCLFVYFIHVYTYMQNFLLFEYIVV